MAGAWDYGEGWYGGEPESSDSLKAFGEVVRSFRKHPAMTQEQLAALVRYSPHTIRSIEQGRRFPPPDFAARADEALNAFGTIRHVAKHLSRNPGLATWFRIWAKMEQEAAQLCTYECRIVPGLLQTEAYMRASFSGQCLSCRTPNLKRGLLRGWTGRPYFASGRRRNTASSWRKRCSGAVRAVLRSPVASSTTCWSSPNSATSWCS